MVLPGDRAPLVVAITEIGLDTHRMKPENAAALLAPCLGADLPFLASCGAAPSRSEERGITGPPDEPTEIYEDEADI
jgi:hypothetical protein